MKNKIKIIIAVVFTFVIANAKAQNRPVYKAIQKVSQKPSDERVLKLSSVGYPMWTVSKDVHRIRSEYSHKTTRGNVVSAGYPEWTISKGVHRIKKENRKTDYKSKPRKDDIIARR